ncbi:MAG: protein translocase subunit SecF [Deltaproteobacteria bacterium]|nr:protein translocase subunit SecF [Deltaproteobacteria bacterium]
MAQKFFQLIPPGTNFEFVKRMKLWFGLSITLVGLSIGMMVVNHYRKGEVLNFGIDFKGGTEMLVDFKKPVEAGAVRNALKGVVKDVEVIAYSGSDVKYGFSVRTPETTTVAEAERLKQADAIAKKFEDREIYLVKWRGDTLQIRAGKEIKRDELFAAINGLGSGIRAKPAEKIEIKQKLSEYVIDAPVFGLDVKVRDALEKSLGADVINDIPRVETVGAKAGEELRNDGIKSLVYAIILIMLYIAFRFDFRFGPPTVVALLHDSILVIGAYAVLWLEVNLTTVAALLTVIGFSMNDTVVVFDRIREDAARYKDRKFDRVVNTAVNETLSRTILTSATVFFVTLAMNIFGTGVIRNFAFAMNVGIIVGTYSSVFIAAPILIWLTQRYSERPLPARSARPARTEA